MKKILLDNDYAEVSYDASMKLGKILWKRKPDFEEYRKPFIELLEHAKTHEVENFLSDIRNQKVVSPQHRKWFETDALPTAVNERGLKRAATIMDGNIFKKYYLDMLIKASGKFKLPLKTFTSEEKALEWFQKEMAKEEKVGG
jgi:hypothetical protein